ncbi:MAG TPA: methyltransferase domain-containing protein [Gemmataceae bacterium]
MKRRHFEALRPVCPLCRSRNLPDSPLAVGLEAVADGDTLLQGALHCTSQACQCEYPVIDGIPLLVPQVRSYVANNIYHLTARRDLAAEVEAMLGDCGPGSAVDATRLHLSSYAWDHYAEFDPDEPRGDLAPGSVARVLDRGLKLAGDMPAGPVLDAGCAAGRSTFELGRRCDGLVLGVDLNFSLLGLAADVLRRGVVTYPRRRVGLVYDRREFAVPFRDAANVDFWVCDATALPFPAGTFAAAASLNVLDCVPSPLDLLGSLAGVLRPGAPLVLSTPYDWSGAVTAPPAWVGGHSDRSPGKGAAEPVLRALLTPGGHPASVAGLRLAAEDAAVPWHVRVHDRSVTAYSVHLVTARAVGPVEQ